MASYSDRVLALARKKGVIQSSDLEERGIPRQYLHRLYKRGILERVGRGLYRLVDQDVTELHTVADAASRVSDGVVCLLSALRFHEMTTQAPYEVWLAIGSKARRPKSEQIPIRIIHMSDEAHEAGVVEEHVEGVPVRIFDPAKTVADCFKFRNKIGLDVAIEALRDYRKRKDFSVDALWRYAKICRVSNVIRPYLEATV